MSAGQDHALTGRPARQPAGLIAFAGGGTGGHLYPMLAIAREVHQRCPDTRFLFFTTSRPIDDRLIDQSFGDDIARRIPQPVKPLPRSLRDAPGFYTAWRASLRLCRNTLSDQEPDVVIGSGGYGSAPAVCSARKLRIPTALLNPDARPGRANRYLASKADVVFAQWLTTRTFFQKSVDIRVVGCPVRAEFADPDRSAGMRRFGLDGAKKTLLVTGASQGAQSINRAMASAASDWQWPGDWQILHLTGQADLEFVRSAYAARRLPARVLAYTDDMPEALAAADLVLARAGASTLAEITACGRPSVLMPYPYHRDRHQDANAAVLTNAGAARMIQDRITPETNAAAIAKLLAPLMNQPATLSAMARHAADLGTTGAAAKIADYVFDLVGRCPDPRRAPMGFTYARSALVGQVENLTHRSFDPVRQVNGR